MATSVIGPPPETDEELLQLSTVSRRWDIPVSTLTYWIRHKRLPAYVVGRSYRVRPADVWALIQPVEQEGGASA